MSDTDSCQEKILSENYRDFIVSDVRMPFLKDLFHDNYCLQDPGFFYQCAYIPASVVDPISLERYSYFSIPCSICRRSMMPGFFRFRTIPHCS